MLPQIAAVATKSIWHYWAREDHVAGEIGGASLELLVWLAEVQLEAANLGQAEVVPVPKVLPKKAKAKRKQTATSVGGQTEKSSEGKTEKKRRKHQEVSY